MSNVWQQGGQKNRAAFPDVLVYQATVVLCIQMRVKNLGDYSDDLIVAKSCILLLILVKLSFFVVRG